MRDFFVLVLVTMRHFDNESHHKLNFIKLRPSVLGKKQSNERVPAHTLNVVRFVTSPFLPAEHGNIIQE